MGIPRFERPWKTRGLADVWDWPIQNYMNIFGWWAEDCKKPSTVLVVKILRATFLVSNAIFSFATAFGIGLQFYRTQNVMESLFAVFCAAIIYLGMGKIGAIVYYRKKIRHIWNELDDMLKDNVRRGINNELEQILRKRFRKAWCVWWFFLIEPSILVANWLLTPIVNALFGERTPIMDVWPSFLDTWEGWFGTYVYQWMSVASLGHAINMYDSTFYCTSEIILSQFDTLRHNLDLMNISKGKDCGRTLEYCIEHHNKLLKVCSVLKECSTFVIMMQVLWTVIMLCIGCFEVVGNKQSDSMLLGSLMMASCTITCNLFMYSWYSNEMTLKANDVTLSCYMSDWQQGDKSKRKSLMLMMSRAMKLVKFGGIIDMDLSTFINVLKTAFSYYQFLITMENAKKHKEL